MLGLKYIYVVLISARKQQQQQNPHAKKARFDTTNMKSKGKFQHLCCIKCGDFLFFFFQWEHERAVKLDVGEIALKKTLYSIQKGDFCTGSGSDCIPQRMELCRQQVSWWRCWGKAW